MAKEGDWVIPGDRTDVQEFDKAVLIGPGITGLSNTGFISATCGGRLNKSVRKTFWVTSKTYSYVPRNNDLVVGTIVSVQGDEYKVDINGPELAVLSAYAFEGATKKKKPTLEEGDIIFTRVVLANVGMEPEIMCIDSYYKAGLLGVLSNGFMFLARLDFVHQLLCPDDLFLVTLGQKIPYEIVVGVNGAIWVKGRTATATQYVYSCIMISEEEFVNTDCTLTPRVREIIQK